MARVLTPFPARQVGCRATQRDEQREPTNKSGYSPVTRPVPMSSLCCIADVCELRIPDSMDGHAPDPPRAGIDPNASEPTWECPNAIPRPHRPGTAMGGGHARFQALHHRDEATGIRYRIRSQGRRPESPRRAPRNHGRTAGSRPEPPGALTEFTPYSGTPPRSEAPRRRGRTRAGARHYSVRTLRAHGPRLAARLRSQPSMSQSSPNEAQISDQSSRPPFTRSSGRRPREMPRHRL